MLEPVPGKEDPAIVRIASLSDSSLYYMLTSAVAGLLEEDREWLLGDSGY